MSAFFEKTFKEIFSELPQPYKKNKKELSPFQQT
jgi:hypothetical protein